MPALRAVKAAGAVLGISCCFSPLASLEGSGGFILLICTLCQVHEHGLMKIH